jgi:NDP-sugar pyrophosphorylase family protein
MPTNFLELGELEIKKNAVTSFKEKVQSSINWISGGYFVLNYEIFKKSKIIDDHNSVLTMSRILSAFGMSPSS